MRNRYEEARLDAWISDNIQRNVLGVLEPDQPGPYSDFLMIEREHKLTADFTAAERRAIRVALGLLAEDWARS